MCVSNTWLNTEEKRKVTFRMCENGKKNNFVLIKKTRMIYVDCEVNPWGVLACISGSRYR